MPIKKKKKLQQVDARKTDFRLASLKTTTAILTSTCSAGFTPGTEVSLMITHLAEWLTLLESSSRFGIGLSRQLRVGLFV